MPPQYFIDLYKREADPWNFIASPYEKHKYEATLASLPRERYDNALEIGCSIGVFTNMLAPRCAKLLAIDVSPEALADASQRCAQHQQVRFEQRTMPREYPGENFDLTTICEVGYYFSEDDLRALINNVVLHAASGGHIILVHWTPPVEGHACSAEHVHEMFASSPAVRRLCGFSKETYRLDLFERRKPH